MAKDERGLRSPEGKSYPGAFEEAWAAYPKRAGPNPKLPAFKAWRARLVEGKEASELLACVKEYALYIQKTGKLGTEYVMQAQTFFGPNERWKDFSPPPDIPAPKPIPPKHPIEEERVDARPFLKEIIEKLTKGWTSCGK